MQNIKNIRSKLGTSNKFKKILINYCATVPLGRNNKKLFIFLKYSIFVLNETITKLILIHRSQFPDVMMTSDECGQFRYVFHVEMICN